MIQQRKFFPFSCSNVLCTVRWQCKQTPRSLLPVRTYYTGRLYQLIDFSSHWKHVTASTERPEMIFDLLIIAPDWPTSRRHRLHLNPIVNKSLRLFSKALHFYIPANRQEWSTETLVSLHFWNFLLPPFYSVQCIASCANDCSAVLPWQKSNTKPDVV